MSSPTQSTRSEGSFHGSSQHAAAEDIQDTAMSVADIHVAPRSVAVETATSASGACMMPGNTVTYPQSLPMQRFREISRQGVHGLCRPL